ncbi:MAG: hypothetical protein EON51_10330 [Acinetobacter sp.]|nr:MAG: hypothetical protein EON51_10330 [Acinetobacter sp.]
MSNSLSHIPVSIHPTIRNLNVRQISKIIATKIIETTALQLQFNPTFCKQLDVSQHLNTYEAVAYFTDHQYFGKYGFNKQGLISFQELYDDLLSIFYSVIQPE